MAVSSVISTMSGAWKNMSTFQKVMTGLEVVDPVMNVAQAKKEGHSTTAAIGKGLASYAVMELFPGLGWGLIAKDLASAAGQGIKTRSDLVLSNTGKNYSHQFGGNFVDTQATYTMRQRGLAAIQNNGINARSVLGNEARLYSRGRYE